MSKTSSSRSQPRQTTGKPLPPEITPSVARLYKDHRFRQNILLSAGISICKSCTAISAEKHWFIDPERFKSLRSRKETRQTLCPGCTRVTQKLYEGQVILSGKVLSQESESVLALIKHTEGKAWHDNPLSRIALMESTDNRLEILTTTRWLAARIGKEFQKSFKGTLKIKPSPREKFVRVYWSGPAS